MKTDNISGINVLSLFNGISCGRVALERAGIPVNRYVSYEIDKYANKIAQKNYPDDEYNGDVTTADFTQYKGFDLLIGGSPCTYWSIAKKGREVTPDGIGGQLFMHFVRALKESGCKYFLYENNYSIHKDIKAFISEQLGVELIMINSALVSAQQRKRCYWTNILNVQQPDDKGILLKDIIESGLCDRDKIRCLLSSCGRTTTREYFITHQGQMCAEPVICQRPHGFNKGGIKKDKSPTLTATGSWIYNNHIVEPVPINTTVDDKARILKAQYSNTGPANILGNLNGKAHFNSTGVAEPVRVDHIGKSKGQANRVYSTEGKSVCLQSQAGGGGALTGLYAIPVEFKEDSVPTKAISNADGKTYPVYIVSDGQITIKENTYPINLPNGYYIIRKLTPIETERLQTLPDNYTEGVSNTQRYKCIGNSWTVDVIAHILKNYKFERDIKMNYKEFLENKVAIAPSSGFEVENINPALFPHQADSVRWCCKGGNRAIFASFGNGKTVMGLETAHQCAVKSGKQSLIICPLGVKQEFTQDAVNLLGYEKPEYVRTQAEVENCKTEIMITNYERVRDGDIDVSYFG
ncbi:MAG: DNA (cytosine-5-)-methyltransferase, partial [Ruminococcus sp.]